MILEWLGSILRGIFLWFDKVIYGFVGTVYNLLVDIAQTSIFTEEIIDLFAERVYALLGIFMLFKVSFSILTYIVNPDEFADKNKGFGKLISNVLITLTLLIATPWIFSQAMDIQRIILRDNIIGKVFVGISSQNSITEANSNPGMIMSYETLKAFYHIDYTAYPECENIETNGSGPTNNSDCQANAFGGKNEYDSYRQTLLYASNTKSVDIYLDGALAGAKDSNGNYTMVYVPVLSTACGIVLSSLLVVFCFDIALRSVQLGFLRMIAPIPIVSRIDPKKGKEVFDKWVKKCISTYLDLFVRLLAIYFAVFVISNVVNLRPVDAVTGMQTDVNPFVKVFIILGALLFAKQLPKLIEDLTGVKMSGKFTLNPLKKLGEVPVVGKAANLAIGGADSVIHGNGFMAGMKRNWKTVPLGGSDGKASIFDTADRKLRKEVNEKRDTARQRYEGKKAYSDINDNWSQGDKIKKKIESHMRATGQVADFKEAFDGKTEGNYASAFKNHQFISSKMAFDRQDAKNKEFSKALETMRANPGKRADQIWDIHNGTDAEKAANLQKLKSLGLLEMDASGRVISTKYTFEEVYETADKSAKTLKGLESVHETMRKQYKEDADVEDAYKFRKYNDNNPTDRR